MIFGSTQMNAPSRFISEIPEHLLEYEERKKGRENSEFSETSSNQSASSKRKSSFETCKKAKSDALRPGDSVAHPTFGNGVVVKIEGTLATIAFRTKGIKKLALGIAPLQKI
jgi:DNA helicase-2/ATP-dependent DNA helicase PcrA